MSLRQVYHDKENVTLMIQPLFSMHTVHQLCVTYDNCMSKECHVKEEEKCR